MEIQEFYLLLANFGVVWMTTIKINAFLHILQSRPIGHIVVFAGPILAPEPNVWHPCSTMLHLHPFPRSLNSVPAVAALLAWAKFLQ